MPSFFFRRRLPASSSSAAVTAEPQAVDPIPEGQINAPLIDRRIHHDINALAEQLSLSFSPSYHLDVAAPRKPTSDDFSENQIFTPLKPNPRRNRVFANVQNQGLIQRGGSEGKAEKNLEENETKADADTNSFSPAVPFADSPSGTFGRRAIHRDKFQRRVPKAKSSFSQSTRSQPRSRDSSRSRDSDSGSQPRTPGSLLYSQYNSSSSLNSGRNNAPSASPSIFGRPTPSGSTAASSSNAYFGHRETPPPLPPLDHPAFRFASKSYNKFPEQQIGDDKGYPEGAKEQQDKPRHSYSLPSLNRSRSLSLNLQHKRSKSRSSTFISEANQTNTIESSRGGHTRSQSKSSINSSRRSSAEISAKNASLVGHGLEYEKTWEAQVSRELLRLSLPHGMVKGRLSTRGNNRSHGESGEAWSLGSPFSFQDTFTHNLTPTLSHHRSPATEENSRYPRKPLTDSGANSMSEGDVVRAAGYVKARKKTGKEGSSSSTTSSSRKAGKSSTRSTPERTRTPSPPPNLNMFSSATSGQNTSLLVPPTLSFTAATPEASPISPTRRTHHKSTPTHPTSVLRTPSPPPHIQKSYSSGSGKRKADEAEVEGGTPPKDQRSHHTTFAPEPRTHRASATSGSSHAPSSYHRNKRARISLSSDSHPTTRTATSSSGDNPNANNTGSWSSRGSTNLVAQVQNSRPSSTKEVSSAPPRRPASRRSLSQASIPISAFMSPHAPSISRSSTFHMRDPRKPARIQDTPWSLSFPDAVDGEGRWSVAGWVGRGGSPLHAWMFFLGFIVFPLWWAAALFIPIPKTRRLEAGETEKGVILDDPQVEHDAKSWRRRCRIMAVVSLVTYLPFIVLVAIFAP